MASNQTSNYGLNQWEATDQVLRTDFNADNAKIDAALKGLADQNAALEGMVAAATTAAGNCEMELITYTGTGTKGSGNATKINFSSLPDLFIVGGDKTLLFGRGGVTNTIIASEDFLNNQTASWNGTRLLIENSVNARYQMNSKGMPYWAMGLKRKI